MTLLLAGSILLIAGSAVALIAGWANAEETYIWTSIAATAAAAVLLVIAFYRSKSTATPLSGADGEQRGAEIDPEIRTDREQRSRGKYARSTSRGNAQDESAQDESAQDESAQDESAQDESAQTQVLAPDAQPSGDASSEKSDAAGAGAASAATAATVGPPAGDQETKALDAGEAEQPDAGGAEASDQSVVAVPKTKKFHRSECRFASAKNTETLSRSDAESRGFEPCGSCNP